MTSGVRCADTMRTSLGHAESSSTSIAACITGRSESLPMITPTSGPCGLGSAPHARNGNGTMSGMRTRLTEMLGIEHPVMLAGMGGVSFARLVAAVSDAGGFGTLGAATMSTEELEFGDAAGPRAHSAPFGVDLLAALPERMVAGAEEIVKGGASLFVAGLGVPREIIEVLHDGNVLVASMCGKVRHAIAAVEAGCDFVIAQGTEAGGHTGTVATFPLVPQIVDEVGERVPVVAAGGIFDGRGLAAALGARRRRRVDRHPLHRDTRGAHGARATRKRSSARPRTARSSAGASPARRCARCETSGRSTSRSTPRSCARSRSR